MAGSISDKYIWAPHPKHAYIAARAISHNNTETTLESVLGEKFTLPTEQVAKCDIASSSTLTDIYDNLVNLEEFTVGAICHQLRERYQKDHIYTWIGNILVSINPFKMLQIYSSDVLQQYKEAQRALASAVSGQPPHIFGLAGVAYTQMGLDERPQAFVISGESGAGKTEATKLILSYLSEVAGSPTGVEQEILFTNPLLEAFGNAKTLRNNNSSRFGKWMEVRFDRSLKISGAKIVNYLLEKSRVVFQIANERNYHIFYQMCAGVEGMDYLHLGDPSSFKYLNQSGCTTIPGVDDVRDYNETCTSLQKLDFSMEEITEIHALVAGVLHLGNLEFEAKGEGSAIHNSPQLNISSSILKMDSDALHNALTVRSVTIRGETQNILLKVSDAVASRDAVAKTLYAKLFDWIVMKVNRKLMKSKDTLTIGVLDIFGFEVFQVNSFEQFCINFANEKLQNHFTKHIFQMEQAEYASEAIDVARIEFEDNEECIQLIEGNPGVIRILDEEVFVPKGSDDSLIEKLHKQFYPSDKVKHKYYNIIKKKKSVFIICHYAGEVEYEIAGFLEKNKDTLHESLTESFKKSKSSLIVQLFSYTMEEEELPKGGKDPKTPVKNAGGAGPKKGKVTLGSQFKGQLDSLLSTLNAADPHFVRCVKPNLEKIPNYFNADLILKQMKYAGLFEAIRIRAIGYSYRKPHDLFYRMYEVCLPRQTRAEISEMKENRGKIGCETLLKTLSKELDLNQIKMGRTKVFYRASQLAILEGKRDIAIRETAIWLQAKWRGRVARRNFKKMKEAYAMCKDALKIRNMQKISNALEFARSKNFEFAIMKELTEIFEFLQQQDKIKQMLSKAVADRDLDRIEGALVQADKMNLIEKSKETDVLELLAHAETVADEIRALYKATAALNEALLTLDVKILSGALSAAEKAGVDLKIIQQAKETLKEWQRQVDLVLKVEKLTKDRNIPELEKALRETESIDITDERKVILKAANQAILEHLDKKMQSFINSADEEAVKLMFEEIKASIVWSFSTEIIKRGKFFLQDQEDRRREEEERRRNAEEEAKLRAEQKRIEAEQTRIKAEQERVNNLNATLKAQAAKKLEEELKKLHEEELALEQKRKEEEIASKKAIEEAQAAAALRAKLQADEAQAASKEPQAASVQSSSTTVKADSKDQDFPEVAHLTSPMTIRKNRKIAGKIGAQLAEQSQLLQDLRKAVIALDREKMIDLLNNARTIGIVGEFKELVKAKEYCFGLTDDEFLDLKLSKAVSRAQVTKVRVFLGQMQKKGLNTVSMNLAKQFLQTKMEESRQKVSKTGIYRDYTTTFKNLRDLTLPTSYPFLRKKDDYAKKGLFSNKVLEDGMLLFSEEPIPKSLIDFSVDPNVTKLKAKELQDLALQINKDILHYMKIRYHQFPAALAVNIIKIATENAPIRDEIFLQIIKQTKNNPNVLSAALALKLLYLCLTCFRPSKKMEDILKSHLASLANPQLGKLSTYDIMEDVSGRCFELLESPLSAKPHAPTQNDAVSFYDLNSEKITFIIENDSGREMVSKKSSEFVVRIPVIPKDLKDVIVLKEGNVLAHDLATHVSLHLRLPFIGKIKLTDIPPELKIEGDGTLSDKEDIVHLIDQIKNSSWAKKLQWHLVPGDEKLEEESKDDEFDDETDTNDFELDDEQNDEPPPPPPPEEEAATPISAELLVMRTQQKKKAPEPKKEVKRKTAAERLEELRQKEAQKKDEVKAKVDQAQSLKERAKALREKKEKAQADSMADIPIGEDMSDSGTGSRRNISLKSTIKKSTAASLGMSGLSSRSKTPELKSTLAKKGTTPSAHSLFEKKTNEEEPPPPKE